MSKPFAAWQFTNFRLFYIARLALTMAILMQSVITAWIVYKYTNDTFLLGLTGLAEAIPAIGVGLYAGHLADKYSRKKIIIYALAVLIIASAIISWFNYHEHRYYSGANVLPLFAFTFVFGLCRGFLASSITAFAAGLVPKEVLPNMISWNTSAWYIGAVTGPAIGGILYEYSNAGVASICFTLLMLLSLVCYFFISSSTEKNEHQNSTTFMEGLKTSIAYMKENKILLGSITIDLLAVMFGDAIILLPALANEKLFINAYQTGWLRAAPAVGSIIMAILLAFYPPLQNSGKKLLVVVALFGCSMIAFGCSTGFASAFIALALSGLFDTVSVVIRTTILQTTTPGNMRGRISAINSIFIGSSNEIGAFVSGTMAKILLVTPAIITGGFITIAVAIIAVFVFPQLVRYHIGKG